MPLRQRLAFSACMACTFFNDTVLLLLLLPLVPATLCLPHLQAVQLSLLILGTTTVRSASALATVCKTGKTARIGLANGQGREGERSAHLK